MIIKIKEKLIGSKHPCFIIAEVGVNHNGDINLAKKLIDEAKKAGVDAVKFQTFKSEQLVTPDAEQAEYQTKNIGQKESQYLMLKKLELSYSDFRELKNYCDNMGIIFLSTPHSCKEDIDLVSELSPAIKIASGDLTNLPMLEYVARKNLPIILSTGMSDLDEVKEAVDTIIPINKGLILLHCTTNYPTAIKEVNLKAMKTMADAFNLPTGYSDHTEGINVSLAAVVLGAVVIEKHFTLDKDLIGPDHRASLEPEKLASLVKGIREIEARLVKEEPKAILKELKAEEAMGDGIKKPTEKEKEVIGVARKSIIAAENIKKGTIINEDMLTIKRPGTGILPKYINQIVGKAAKEDIKKDSLIKWEQIG